MFRKTLHTVKPSLRTDDFVMDMLLKFRAKNYTGTLDDVKSYFHSMHEAYSPLTPSSAPDIHPNIQFMYNLHAEHHNSNVGIYGARLLASKHILRKVEQLQSTGNIVPEEVLPLCEIVCASRALGWMMDYTPETKATATHHNV